MKVKKLEWDEYPSANAASAGGLGFRYVAGVDLEGVAYWGFPCGPGEKVTGTIEDAMAAAQADFERRVMEYIEPGVSHG